MTLRIVRPWRLAPERDLQPKRRLPDEKRQRRLLAEEVERFRKEVPQEEPLEARAGASRRPFNLGRPGLRQPGRALSGGQIGQPADVADEDRGGLGDLFRGLLGAAKATPDFISGLPLPGGIGTVLPSGSGGRPGVSISGFGQPEERTVGAALEFEGSITEPVTRPVGRFVGEQAVQAIALKLNIPRDAPGRERAVEIGGIAGEEVFAAGLRPTNLIPIPIIDPLVARAILLPAKLARGGAKVAPEAAQAILRRIRGVADDVAVEPAVRQAASRDSEALRAAIEGTAERPVTGAADVPLGPSEPPRGAQPAPGEPVPELRPPDAADAPVESGTLATVADDAERAARDGGPAPPEPSEPPVGLPGDKPELPSPRVLKTVDEIAQDIRRSTQNFVGATTRAAGRFPPLRAMIDFVNPSALVERPPKGLVDELGEQGAIDLQTRLIAHGRKMDQGSAISAVIEDGVRLRGREVGFQMEDGLVVSVDGSPPIGDLFENPSRYSLTPEQRRFVDDVQSVLDDMNAAEKAAGVKKSEIFSGEGRYFPRQVREVRGVEKIRADVRRIVGARQGFSKERFYATMQDGIDAGVRYEDDVGAIVGTRIRAGIKAAADEELARLVRPLGRTLKAPKRTAGIAELGTMTPALGGRVFKPETARIIMDALNPAPPGATLRGLDAVNNLIRPINATGELSFWGIQMMTSLFRNPVAFAKGAAMSLDGLLLDGRFYGRFIQSNSDWIERFIANDGVWNGSEFTFEQAVRNKTIRGLFEKLGVKGVLGRFDQAFNQALNVTALENFKGMVGLTDNLGPSRVSQVLRAAMGDIAGETSEQVAASIASKMTGRVSVRGLGVKATQRAVESSLAFAPRYYRAIFGLLGDALQGGMRGAEARRILGSLFAGALAVHVGAAYALGQEPRLDPRRSDFLTVTIRGQKIGIGGPIYGIGRMLAESVENPDKLKSFSMDNPVVRWARGRTAPVLSLVTDLVTQKDFLGRPIDSAADVLRTLAKAPLPFIAQQGIEEGPEALVPQAFGLRAFPESEFTRFRAAQEQVFQERKAAGEQPFVNFASYEELREADRPAAEQIDQDPRVQEALQGFEQSRRRETPRSRFFEETDVVREEFRQEQERDDDLLGRWFRSGGEQGMPPSNWQDGERERAKTSFDQREGIRRAFGIEFETEEGKLPSRSVNAAMERYFGVDIERYTDQQTQEVEWGAYFDAKDRALAGLSSAERTRVMDFINRSETGIQREFRKLRDELDPYYDIPSEDRDGRLRWRRRNPRGDAILFVTGSTASLRSSAAFREAEALARRIFGSAAQIPRGERPPPLTVPSGGTTGGGIFERDPLRQPVLIR